MKNPKVVVVCAIASMLGGLAVAWLPPRVSRLIEASRSAPAPTQTASSGNQSQDPEIPAEAMARYEMIDPDREWYVALYRDRNFKKVGDHIRALLQDESNSQQDSMALVYLYERLGEIQGADRKATEADGYQFAEQKGVLDAWVAAEPDSHLPFLLRGCLLSSYAHEFRTNQFWNKVPAPDLEEAGRLWDKAASDLLRAAELNPEDPNIWSELMKVAAYGGDEEYAEMFYERGVTLNPLHFALNARRHKQLHPNWGGSWPERSQFAEEMSERGVAQGWPLLGLFQLADYRRLRYKQPDIMAQPEAQVVIVETYDRIFNQHPDALRMRFYYAYDAFYSQQYELAAAQFEQIGDRWITGTIWKTLEEYHRTRALLYLKVAHDAFMAEDNPKAQLWAERSNALIPTAKGMLLVGNAVVNQTGNPLDGLDYSRRALELNPNPKQKRLAEDYLEKHGGKVLD